MSPHNLLDLSQLERRLPELRDQYRSASPFPHIVLDDLIAPEVVRAAHEEIAALPEDGWSNYLHLNERKYAHKQPAAWGPTLQGLASRFMDERFLAFVEGLSGIPSLLPDPVMDGGGLHRSLPGGFLNVHADFSVHHDDPDLRRQVNLLLYLHPDWDEAWGGQLELWDPSMQHMVATVAPKPGRGLLFTTSATSYHGHPDALRCPEGIARESLALYYFTREPGGRIRSTDYRARPGDGAKAIGIYLDRQALKAYDTVKRRLRLSDRAVSGWLGALRRKRD